MQHQSVPLRFGPRPWARLRGLSGADEVAVAGVATEDALRLLDALLLPASGWSLAPGSAGELAAADRDQLLAAVYRSAFGDRILSTVSCGSCGERFDLSFSLAALARSRALPARPLVGTLRLPTGHDECEVAVLPPAEAERALLARCGGEGMDPAEASAAMDDVAPVLALELDARCAECGAGQPVGFDVQSYLLRSLLGERARLLDEVHRLARAYGWSWTEIMGLPRSNRRALARRLEGDERSAWSMA